ncbi:MAG: hypothetical protein ACRET7_05655, partial [Burkholderiales bacterium]
LIRPEGPGEWQRSRLEGGSVLRRIDDADLHVGYHKGYSIYRRGGKFSAQLSIVERGPFSAGDREWLEAPTLDGVKQRIDAQNSAGAVAVALFTRMFVVVSLAVQHLMRRTQRSLLAQGGASSAKSRTPLSDLPRRFLYRLDQFAVRCRALGDALFHLIPNLWHIGRRGGAAPLRILVDSRPAENYLKLLRAVGAIPFVRLERVDDRDQFCRILGSAPQDGPGASLLVNRGLYFRYYPDAVPLRDRVGLVVL